jgi:hypothetical protein
MTEPSTVSNSGIQFFSENALHQKYEVDYPMGSSKRGDPSGDFMSWETQWDPSGDFMSWETQWDPSGDFMSWETQWVRPRGPHWGLERILPSGFGQDMTLRARNPVGPLNMVQKMSANPRGTQWRLEERDPQWGLTTLVQKMSAKPSGAFKLWREK